VAVELLAMLVTAVLVALGETPAMREVMLQQALAVAGVVAVLVLQIPQVVAEVLAHTA
jgi:hypothetical protein